MARSVGYIGLDLARIEARQRGLQTLGVCHYVWGGIVIAFSSLFLLHVGAGTMMLLHPQALIDPTDPDGSAPAWVTALALGLAASVVLFGWVLGLLTISSGRCIRRGARRAFSLAIAIVNLPLFPVGTALGLLTLWQLTRPDTVRLYSAGLQPGLA